MSLKNIINTHNKSFQVNHHDLLDITEEFINLGKNYFDKYPSAQNFINLNGELFNKNPQAEIEYKIASMKQEELTKKFFNYQKIICQDPANKDLEICSEMFENFYVSKQYHYGQNTYDIVKILSNDIKNIEKKFKI